MILPNSDLVRYNFSLTGHRLHLRIAVYVVHGLTEYRHECPNMAHNLRRNVGGSTGITSPPASAGSGTTSRTQACGRSLSAVESSFGTDNRNITSTINQNSAHEASAALMPKFSRESGRTRTG